MLNRTIQVVPDSISKGRFKKSKIKKSKVKKKIKDKGLDNIVDEDDSNSKDTLNNVLAIKEHRKNIAIKIRENLERSPWIEKYRPKHIDDVVMSDRTRQAVTKIIKDKNMPNIIITGLPGIGKTTTNMCIARSLLGKYYNQAVLELNASDDRGIKSVQETIINFCKKRFVIDGPNKARFASHKIILLDETDNMTKKAQQLINRLMDEYYDTVRFAFTCNRSSEIIEAIQSRCRIFRFVRQDSASVVKRLETICNKEKIEYTKKGLDAIILTSQGDIRKCVNSLQLTYQSSKKITEDNVYRLCDIPSPMILKKMFMACQNKDLKSALEQLEILRSNGYSGSDISLSMVHTLKSRIVQEDLDEATKIRFMKKICETCLVITKGINSPMQLTGCVASMCC